VGACVRALRTVAWPVAVKDFDFVIGQGDPGFAVPGLTLPYSNSSGGKLR